MSSPTTTTVQSQSAPTHETPPLHDAESIPIHLIDTPDANNGRSAIDPARITQLADSIRRIGLLNPVTLARNGNRYTLAAGLHRLRATQLLSFSHIPATILNAPDEATAIARLAENAARSNLSPVEEALQLAPLVDADPNGIDGVAAAIGRTRTWIDTRLEILAWPDELTAAVHDNKIPLGAAQRLAKIHDPAMRAELVYQAITHGINTRTAAEWLRQANTGEAITQPDPDFSCNSPEQRYESTTTTNCFMCRDMKPLEHTVHVRICNECMTELGTQPLEPSTPNAPQDANTPASE